MRLRRLVALVGALVAVLSMFAAIAGAARAPRSARLDPRFGVGGVVQPTPAPVPGVFYAHFSAFVPVRGGGTYALESGYSCPSGAAACATLALVRFSSSGAPDTSFGGSGSVAVPLSGEATTFGVPIVDGRGRVVIPINDNDSEGTVTLRRYLPDGELDSGFGQGGQAKFVCGCRYNASGLSFSGKGRIVVAASFRNASPPNYSVSCTTAIFARFLSNGTLDSAFGSAGVARIQLPPRAETNAFVASPNGALYFGGASSIAESGLYRVSAKGRLDTRFAERTRLVLTRLAREGSGQNLGPESIVLRPHGRIDLFGAESSEKGGSVVRFRPNGTAQPRFGRNGLRELPAVVESAALDGSGGTLASAVARGGSRLVLARLLPSDKLDRSFGRRGFVADEQRSASPRRLTRIGGRRVMVTDLGDNGFCRGPCPPQPSIARFLLLPRGGED